MSVPRVLHVVESWRPVPSGYASRSWNIVEGQLRHGIAEPKVLVTSRQMVYGKSSVTPLSGTEVLQLRATTSEMRWRRVRKFHLDVTALRSAILDAARGCEIVHVHWSSGIGWAAAQAAERLQVPLVAEVRFDLAGAMATETLRGLLPVLETPLRRRFERHLPLAARVIAASQSLAQLLAREFPVLRERLSVIPNGAPSQTVRGDGAAVRKRHGLESKFVIGTTSKMLRYENLGAVLEAARSIPHGQALLAGEGPQRGALERRARRGGRATFAGAVAPAEVPDYLAAMDLFAVPRRAATVTEYASPLKVVEAMAAGLPVVATAVGDARALLSEGRGVLVEPGDRQAFFDAVRDLWQSPDRRREIGEKAAAWVRSEMNWDVLVRRYGEIYAGAMR